MAKRKLNPFTADDAGDSFTPSVKTIVGGDVTNESKTKEKSDKSKTKTKSASKSKKTATRSSDVSPSKTDVESVKGSSGSKKTSEEPKTVNVKKKSSPPSPKTTSKDVGAKSTVVKKQESIIQNVEQKPERLKQEKPAKVKRSKGKKNSEDIKEVIHELVGFILGEEEFGINIKNVHEINRMVDITPVPRAPFFVVGVMNLRGNVVPVINLRRRLNVEDKEADNKTRIIVVEVLNTVVGFVVDAVSEVLRIPASLVEPPSDMIAGIQAEYIKGVAKLQTRLMVLLDLEKIIAKENIDQIKETM